MAKIYNQLLAVGILCCFTFPSEANQRNDLHQLFEMIPRGGEMKPRGPKDNELPSIQNGSSLFNLLQEITNHTIENNVRMHQKDLVKKGNYVYRFAEIHVSLKDKSHPNLWKAEKITMERPPLLIGMVERNGKFENGKYSDIVYRLYNSNNDFIAVIRVVVTDAH